MYLPTYMLHSKIQIIINRVSMRILFVMLSMHCLTVIALRLGSVSGGLPYLGHSNLSLSLAEFKFCRWQHFCTPWTLVHDFQSHIHVYRNKCTFNENSLICHNSIVSSGVIFKQWTPVQCFLGYFTSLLIYVYL